MDGSKPWRFFPCYHSTLLRAYMEQEGYDVKRTAYLELHQITTYNLTRLRDPDYLEDQIFESLRYNPNSENCKQPKIVIIDECDSYVQNGYIFQDFIESIWDGTLYIKGEEAQLKPGAFFFVMSNKGLEADKFPFTRNNELVGIWNARTGKKVSNFFSNDKERPKGKDFRSRMYDEIYLPSLDDWSYKKHEYIGKYCSDEPFSVSHLEKIILICFHIHKMYKINKISKEVLAYFAVYDRSGLSRRTLELEIMKSTTPPKDGVFESKHLPRSAKNNKYLERAKTICVLMKVKGSKSSILFSETYDEMKGLILDESPCLDVLNKLKEKEEKPLEIFWDSTTTK